MHVLWQFVEPMAVQPDELASNLNRYMPFAFYVHLLGFVKKLAQADALLNAGKSMRFSLSAIILICLVGCCSRYAITSESGDYMRIDVDLTLWEALSGEDAHNWVVGHNVTCEEGITEVCYLPFDGISLVWITG